MYRSGLFVVTASSSAAALLISDNYYSLPLITSAVVTDLTEEKERRSARRRGEDQLDRHDGNTGTVARYGAAYKSARMDCCSFHFGFPLLPLPPPASPQTTGDYTKRAHTCVRG